MQWHGTESPSTCFTVEANDYSCRGPSLDKVDHDAVLLLWKLMKPRKRGFFMHFSCIEISRGGGEGGLEWDGQIPRVFPLDETFRPQLTVPALTTVCIFCAAMRHMPVWPLARVMSARCSLAGTGCGRRLYLVLYVECRMPCMRGPLLTEEFICLDTFT